MSYLSWNLQVEFVTFLLVKGQYKDKSSASYKKTHHDASIQFLIFPDSVWMIWVMYDNDGP